MFGRNTDAGADVIFLEDDSGLYEIIGDPDSDKIMFGVNDFEYHVTLVPFKKNLIFRPSSREDGRNGEVFK